MNIKITKRIYTGRVEILIDEKDLYGEDLENFKQLTFEPIIKNILNSQCINQVIIEITKPMHKPIT